MPMTQTAINYGIVLYQLGVKRGCVKEAKDALLPQVKTVLTDPVLDSGKKHRLIEKIFPAELHNFLKQVSDNQRFDQIEDIFEAYQAYADEQEGILRAKLYYVTPPDEKQREKMELFLKKKHKCSQVRLSMQEAPELLGGFVIRVGNYEYDRSLKGRLMQLKQKMIRR